MGHSDQPVEAQARQQYWMPFSPNKAFKQEPQMFVKGAGSHVDCIVGKLGEVLSRL